MEEPVLRRQIGERLQVGDSFIELDPVDPGPWTVRAITLPRSPTWRWLEDQGLEQAHFPSLADALKALVAADSADPFPRFVWPGLRRVPEGWVSDDGRFLVEERRDGVTLTDLDLGGSEPVDNLWVARGKIALYADSELAFGAEVDDQAPPRRRPGPGSDHR